MAEIKIDTIKMRDCGNRMMELSLSLNEDFKLLFDKLSNVSNHEIWTGEASIAFANRANAEKNQYFQFKDTIYKLGRHLVDDADNFEKEINLLRRD